MFDRVNEVILENAAKALGSGHMSAEDFSKLLNTVARFEERVTPSERTLPQMAEDNSTHQRLQ